MGEAKHKLSATQKFLQQNPKCCFCGGLRAATTREHMPPKSLFNNSHRPDKLIMPACDDCNRRTSTADLTAAIVSRWNYFSDFREIEDHRRLLAQARRQDPQLAKEWAALDTSQVPNARAHLRKFGVPVPPDAGIATIGPLTIRQLNLFAHKLVLALHFEHSRQPLQNSGNIFALWHTKEDYFARDEIPQFLLAMLPNYGTLIQGQWNEKETFEYRHAMNQEEWLFACFSRLRHGLFIFGYTDSSGSSILDDSNSIKSSELLTSLESPRFQLKL